MLEPSPTAGSLQDVIAARSRSAELSRASAFIVHEAYAFMPYTLGSALYQHVSDHQSRFLIVYRYQAGAEEGR